MEDEINREEANLLNKKINFAIAENIQKAREQAKLTQKELSLALGISESTYSRYENGMVDIPMSKIVKISAVTGVSLEKIAGGEKLVEICVDFKALVEKSMSQKEKDNLYRDMMPVMQDMQPHPMRRRADIRGEQVPPSVYGVPSEQDDQIFIKYITNSYYDKKLKSLYSTIELLDAIFEQNDEAYVRALARATIKYVSSASSDKRLKEILKEYVIKCKNEIIKQ